MPKKSHLSHESHTENVITQRIRESYDRISDEYAKRLFRELDHKPLDRQLLDRFAAETKERGKVCDLGCGPGQVARYLRDAGADVSGLDISLGMLHVARQLNPDVHFQQGDMMGLPLDDGTQAGMVAFYAIVNIPEDVLLAVFREIERVLQPDGLLLLAFHIGTKTLQVTELWDRPVSMDFFFFSTAIIQAQLEAAGFTIEEIIEREPYSPDVEHQSRRAYVFAKASFKDQQETRRRNEKTPSNAEPNSSRDTVDGSGV